MGAGAASIVSWERRAGRTKEEMMPLFDVEVAVMVKLTRTIRVGAPNILEAGKRAFDAQKKDIDDGCGTPDFILDIIGMPWSMADYELIKSSNTLTGKATRIR